MSNFKKLMSMVLAIAMLCSTFAIGAQAAYHEYKDSAIKSYDSIDQPVFTAEQLASVALDAVDSMLAEIEEPKIKIPVLNVVINLSSIDVLLESAEPIYNGEVWKTVLNLAGELGSELNFSALYYADPDDGFDNPTFESRGCRRSTPGKSDLDVIYSLLQFINDNAGLLAKYGYGTLKLGATLEGLIEGLLPEFKAYLDAPNLLRGLLYDAVYKPKKTGLPKWDNLSDAEKASDKYKADAMVQLLVDDLMDDLEKSLNRRLGWGISMELSGVLDIDAPNFYDVFEAALQKAYAEIFVPMANTEFKKFFYKFAGVSDATFAKYKITDSDNAVIGYYLDDCSDIAKLRTAGYKFPATSLAADVAAGTVRLNVVGEILNLNYEIENFDFAGSETHEFISELNNIVGGWVEKLAAGKNFDAVEWTYGSLDEFIPNVMKYVKEFIRQYGNRYLSEYITLPTDTAEMDALLAEIVDIEDLVLKFGPELIEYFAPNMLLPENLTSVRAILTYALCELIADKVPEEDIYGQLQSGAIDPNSDAGWQAIVAVIARYYLNALINVNLPKGLTFEQTVTALVDWALKNYGGILDYAADLSSNTSLSAWDKLDEIVFGLIPISWLPQTARVIGDDGNVKTVSLADGSKTVIMDVVIGNILDLKFEHFFDLFKRNPDGELNSSPVSVILGFVRRVLNCVIPGAMPTAFPNIESILTKQALGDIIKGLLTGLYTIRTNLIPGALPLVCMILDLTTAQQIEDPSIMYPDFILSSNLSLNGTSIVVRNASSGLNTAWTDANGVTHQDSLYKVKIVSITPSVSGVNVTYNAGLELNGGDSTSFPVTGSLTNAGLVNFVLAYEILDESGKSLTSSPIEYRIYTYVSNTNPDDDDSYYETDADGYNIYVDGVGMNNHYVISAPSAYISNWSALRGQDYKLGRDSEKDSYMAADAVISYAGFSTTLPAGLVEAAEWTNITTKQAGYIPASFDMFKVNVPQVTAEDGTTKDMKFEDYLEGIGNGTRYTASVTHSFGPTDTADTANVLYTISRNLVFYNDYNLYSIVNDAMAANRQKSNYATSGTFTYVEKTTDEAGNVTETTYTANAATAWNNYINALNAAQAIVLKPRTAATFDATVYGPAAEALKRAAADLDACAVSAGVASLEALREEYQPSNPDGMTYDDPAFNYMGSEDYVLYTWDRYKKHRNNMDSLINSQKVAEPGPDATPEELEAYQTALANIPSLKLFDITYRGHMYEMNAERLVRRASSKNYLQHAYALVTGKVADLNQDDYTAASWGELETAIAFAETVLRDSSADLRQTKINTARQKLIEEFKTLVVKGADPADYAQLNDAIAKAQAIFDTPDYENLYTGLEALTAAYNDALAVAKDLLVDQQGVVDAAAQALLDALALVERIEAGLDFSLAEDVIAGSGCEWTPAIKDGYGDMGDFQFIDGLIIEYGDGIESLIATTGGAEYEYTPNENNGGYIGTGDTITMGDMVYYIVIYGDTTGDGMLDANDIIEMGYLMTGELYDELGLRVKAGDINGDESVDGMDVVKSGYMLLGEEDVYTMSQDGNF